GRAAVRVVPSAERTRGPMRTGCPAAFLSVTRSLLAGATASVNCKVRVRGLVRRRSPACGELWARKAWADTLVGRANAVSATHAALARMMTRIGLAMGFLWRAGR